MRALKISLVALLALIILLTIFLSGNISLNKIKAPSRANSNVSEYLLVSLSLKEPSYAPGETIEYDITLKNRSDKDILKLKITDSLTGKEESLDRLRGMDEFVIKESYKIPEEFEDEYVEAKVTAIGELEGQSLTSSDSFEAYMERFSSMEYEEED